MDHSLPLIPKAFRRGPWQGARLIDCWSDWLFWYRVTVAIHSVLWLFTKVVYLLHCMVFTWLVPHEITAVLAHVLCTACSHAHAHSVWSHIHRVHVCLAITCHQLFRQNDQDLLHATAVTRGWNRYWNKSQHRKLTLEKKILPELPPGIEPTTFRLQVRRSTTKLPPPPHSHLPLGCHAIYCLNSAVAMHCLDPDADGYCVCSMLTLLICEQSSVRNEHFYSA